MFMENIASNADLELYIADASNSGSDVIVDISAPEDSENFADRITVAAGSVKTPWLYHVSVPPMVNFPYTKQRAS